MPESFFKVCEETCEYLQKKSSKYPPYQRLLSEAFLRDRSKRIRSELFRVFELFKPEASEQALGGSFLKAITWNLERGKNFEAILKVFKGSPHFQDIDLFFLTEVDWGMARSGNRNVAEDLARALGYHAYFAPSYFNLTQGHGSERMIEGCNRLGLHGKAILSRHPLQNLRSVGMPNAINKLKSKEARLGEKRALVADLRWGGEKITLACAHLDAFSSPKARMLQLTEAVKACSFDSRVLIAGDWNTNSINSTSGLTLLQSVLLQLLRPGPEKMIREHFPYPYRKFDKPLFDMLGQHQFDFEGFNETGVGTFDLFENDQEMGMMVGDQYPRWLIHKVNDLIIRSGGLVSLKLDWFAGRRLQALKPRVIRLQKGIDYLQTQRPSDHHPIYLEFKTS